MKLEFLNGTAFFFSDSIELEERLVEVTTLLQIKLTFDNKRMTIEEYFRFTWNEKNTINNMNKIATYLTKLPNQNGKHDKEVLSRNSHMEMNKGVRWTTKEKKKVSERSRYINFSDTNIEDKVLLGIYDTEEI